MKQLKHGLILFVIVFMLAGCGSFLQNAQLTQYEKAEGYRFDNLSMGEKNTDSLFVVVSFSGGGTRAASFSYGVMEALRDTKIQWKGVKKSLLDEVDIISSVSGGSFTAGYYGLHREKLFDGTFEKEFLKHNIERELLKRAISPLYWFKLFGSSYGRSDMAADYYNTSIFKNATYSDFIKKGTRPFIMLNATDMSTGMPFPFIQDQFDLMCSDLAELPLARAVASSSAFPGLLTPLTFQNFAGTCEYKEPMWVKNAEGDRRENPERANLSEKRRTYYLTQAWESRREYIHLIDGGVSDNLGLRGVMFALGNLDSSYSIQRLVNREKIEKLIVIIVNAATDPETKRDRKAKVPGIIDVLTASSTIPLDRYSFDTSDRCQKLADEYNDAVDRRKECEEIMQDKCPGATLSGSLYEIETYVSHLSFDFIPNAEKRYKFKNLPTTFELPAETVDELRKMGGYLLNNDSEFLEFLGSF